MDAVAPPQLSVVERRVIGTPEEFRARLERLGPTFIKMGQFLALRPDLIPAEYGEELLGLLDDTASMPWEEVRALIARGLGQEPETLFAHIERIPQGSGSIAQAHRARLHDGTEVIIKVRRRGIGKRIERDLRLARRFANLVEKLGINLILAPRAAVAEMGIWLQQELDFRRELDNLSRMYDAHAESSGIRIPKPYPELCGDGVLTYEFLDGLMLSRVIGILKSGDAQLIEMLQGFGFDPDRVAYRLLETILTQIFDHRFFAIDLHPGNLLLLADGRLGMIDFGLCGHLNATLRQRLLRYFGAIVREDSDTLYQAAAALLDHTEHSNIEVFKREFYAATSVWTAKRRKPKVAGAEKKESDTHLWLMQIVRAARKARMRVPSDSLALYRALLTAEKVTDMLGAQTDLRKVGGDYFPALQGRDLLAPLSSLEAQGIVGSLVELLKRSPERLEHVLAEIASGRFILGVETHQSSRDQHLANRRAHKITVAIVTVGLVLLLISDVLPVWFGMSLAWPVGIGLGGCYLWLFWSMRRPK